MSKCYFDDSGETTEFMKKLMELDGVSSVEKIEQLQQLENPFAEKYMVTFTQPLDWDDPDAGTFEQIVEIGYSSEDAASLRQKSLDFQVLCIENRDELKDMFWKEAEESG